MALTEVREEAELLRLRLHIARAERDAVRIAAPSGGQAAVLANQAAESGGAGAMTPAVPPRLSAQVGQCLCCPQ